MDRHAIEQYKKELLAQARRTQFFDPPAAVPPRNQEHDPPAEPKTLHMGNASSDPAVVAASEQVAIAAEPAIPAASRRTQVGLVNVNREQNQNNREYNNNQAPPQPQRPVIVTPPPTIVVNTPPASRTETQAQPETPKSTCPRCPNLAATRSVITEEEWFHQPAGDPPTESAVAAPLVPVEPKQLEEIYAHERVPGEIFPDNVTEYFEMPQPQFGSLDDFLAQNSAQGQLTITVLSPNAGTPLQGAQVQVTKQIAGVDYLFFDGQSNEQGFTETSLPTPPKEQSYEESAIPYALYNITVAYADHRQQLLNVPIFPDTIADQVVRLDNSPPINQALYTQ